ncbi:bimA domain protein [Burkholderia pseudomallei]|nr:bimA domain protein [Burkholderia pseudomallei]KGW97537.1 bimA domain protein [Burkholderia pseudomallei MSHR456]KGX79470.1 intracellular mobility A domain protein [Burkholderia pseudomallei MSHR435]
MLNKTPGEPHRPFHFSASRIYYVRPSLRWPSAFPRMRSLSNRLKVRRLTR